MKKRYIKLLSTLFFIIIMSITMTFFAISTPRMIEIYGEKIKIFFKVILVVLLFSWMLLDHYLDIKLSTPKNIKKK